MGGIRHGESRGGTTQLRRDGTCQDEVFEALAHARRRQSLAYLRADEGVVSVDELAKHVASAERAGGERVSPADRKQVATTPYHVHLPKLVDAGLVVWQDTDAREQVNTTSAGQSLPTELSWVPSNVSPSED